jgi:xanthine dehydrogenase YagR molybdenum-binding subunit
VSAPHPARLGFRDVGEQPGVARVVDVRLPAGDLPPWDLDSKLTVVGGAVDRVDAVAKVTGRARYAFDAAPPGLVHAAILRSPHPRARLVRLDLSAAQKLPGVVAAVALKQAGNRIRFAGDELAAVAATTLDQARDAIEQIAVEYEVETHQTDWLQAEGAPQLDAEGQVLDAWPAGGEAIDQALAGAAQQRTATYRCEVQTHSSLESHGVVAWLKADGELEVWASTQGTFGVRSGLARTLGIPEPRVRVHAEYVGGGFGSKLQPGAEAVAAALLSRECGKPVKLMLDRREEHVATGNRPPAVIQIRAGLDAGGRLCAWDYRSFGGPGHTGRGGGTTMPQHYVAQLPRDRRRVQQVDLPSDTDPARAMRAPGRPQGFFATELMLDELALAAGIDPLELRLRNDPHEVRQAEWRHGAARFGWAERRNRAPGEPRDGDPRVLHGAGLSSAFWGQMGGPGNRVLCRIHRDGSVETRNGAQDIGTGMKTVMAMLTAEELQIPVARVRASMGDTQDPPGPASGGSTTTPSLSPTVRLAAARARQKLFELVAADLGTAAADLTLRDGRITTPDGNGVTFADACKRIGAEPIEAIAERERNYDGFQDFVCGCQFAEVAIDVATGLVRVTRMLAVQDCGVVIAPKLAESQVLGAMIQGISYALHEQRIVDHRSGRMVNADFQFYKISGPADMPAMEVVMVPVFNGKNNVGAGGLGEAPATAPAAAIANAVFNAIGTPVRHLPITPDKVLRALSRRNGG